MKHIMIFALLAILALPCCAAQTQLDISRLYNNDGISAANAQKLGSLDKGGYSFPADGFPDDGVLAVGNERFQLANPSASRNNISCAGQEIKLPKGRITKIHVLATAVNGSFVEEMRAKCADGTSYAMDFAISDWCVPAQYNEQPGLEFGQRHGPTPGNIKCTIWKQTIHLKKSGSPAASIILPSNPNIHVFAMTAE